MKKDISSSEIQYIEGSTPVLLLAPHVYQHKRPTLSGAYKIGEPWTDYIVRNLASLTGAHALMSTDVLDYDPNYHGLSKNPFKQYAQDIVKDNKIKYVFDFHGLSNKHNYDLGLFYMPRFRRSKAVCYEIAKALNKEELREVLIHLRNFKKDNQETLVEFLVGKYKMAGVQFEIARYIRDDDILRENLIKLLTGYITTLS